jgi:hypothetical protein
MTRQQMTRRQWAYWVAAFAIYVPLLAAFPRLARWLQWPSRLGPRGLLAYVAAGTAVRFAVIAALPWSRRVAERQERLREELRQRLGREPTDDELITALTAG